MDNLRIEPSKDGQFQWKTFGDNGENTATGETHTREQNAWRGFWQHAAIVVKIASIHGKLDQILADIGYVPGPKDESK